MAVSTIMVIVLATNKVWDSEKGQWLISIFGTFIMFCLLAFAIVTPNIIKAGVVTKMLNEKFETNYTEEQVFWASDLIEEIRQTERTRVELNGNLLNGGVE
jgi:uncharacterized BrkB/YihY/UPF0761 family membrane protein